MVPNYNKIYLYRIIHLDNLEYILDLGKLTCPNHEYKDINYIGIGDNTLIQSRSSKQISLEPFGTFADYVSFYFSKRSPMLYNIFHGYSGVIQRRQEEIIYLVTNYQKVICCGCKYVYFDGHGYHHLSGCYNNESGLIEIDWDIIYSKYWMETEADPDRKRRKQAELLIYREMKINNLIGIGVFNEDVREKISLLLEKKHLNLDCKIKPEWYY